MAVCRKRERRREEEEEGESELAAADGVDRRSLLFPAEVVFDFQDQDEA